MQLVFFRISATQHFLNRLGSQAHRPYAGVQIPLDRPFAYQFPMPLFQTWQQLWPVSSESVKEQLATMVANQNLYLPAGIPIRLPWAGLPEKIPKSRVPERLVL
jgi:hypothetical protein